MNGIDPIWEQVEKFRNTYFSGSQASLPIDVFTVAELNLRLDIIPFDDLFAKYEMDAMILQNFSGIYVDAEAYQYLENGPVWKQKRLRFTFAHELGHLVLHKAEAEQHKFSNFNAFFRWLHEESPERYRIEKEANEFAGRLLVPRARLQSDFDVFSQQVSQIIAQWRTLPDLRRSFADKLSDKYGVNIPVIEIRLDRENIWPTNNFL
jgi:Zn-dependent peptidase ImmA (M78 family)